MLPESIIAIAFFPFRYLPKWACEKKRHDSRYTCAAPPAAASGRSRKQARPFPARRDESD